MSKIRNEVAIDRWTLRQLLDEFDCRVRSDGSLAGMEGYIGAAKAIYIIRNCEFRNAGEFLDRFDAMEFGAE